MENFTLNVFYVILQCLHHTVSCIVLAPSRSNQPGICPSLASAVQLVTSAAITSREPSRGALDGSNSSLEFDHLASSVEWPNLAARTLQHLSPADCTFVQPLRSPRLLLETPAICYQTLHSALTFATRSSPLSV